MSLFIDLDEVLADFTGSALAVHGWDKERLLAEQPPGTWDMCIAMQMTVDEFWAPIHAAGSEFWYSIKPLPWFDDLVSMLSQAEEWYIISSPSRDFSSRLGKMQWVAKYLPQKLDHCFLTKDKELFGRIPGAWLVDDREENLDKFELAGGHGVVFPSWGNKLCHLAHDPLPYVAKRLGAE